MCIDNKTQYVVAVVGGRSENDQYNRAFLSSRQPGSTIKPLLDYGPAIDNGVINGSSIFNDTKVYWDSNDKNSYSPSNSGGGYSGSMTVREALSRSKNTVAFQVFKKTGIETSLSYLEKLKFSSLSYADSSAPAISLGGFTNGVTVNDMCRGYATLANDGQMSSRTCLVRIEHDTNGTIYTAPELEDSETEVYSADTSFIMKDMLQGAFTDSYGTAHSGYNENQIYAGKTGTTNSSKDAWFCGFSAYYTTAVWIGYDTPRVMSGMYGGTYPLKIWTTFMNKIHENLPKQNFEIPRTIELRKVSGGEFTSSSKEINYSSSKRYYSQRPSGYDYYSQLNTDRKSSWQKNYQLNSTKKEAETAVTEFESYKIKSAKDAINFEKKYNNVLAVIDEIPDEYEQSSYKERAATKYNSLSKEVIKKWQKAIKEYEEQQAEEREKQEKIDAEDAANKAKDTLKKNRIKLARWYINMLNKRSYYSSVTKLLIRDGKTALERLEGYSEYDSIKSEFDAAVTKAKKLPTVPETPVIPEDSKDNKEPDENDYPEDTTPTPQPSPETE
jgi:penicillin-binding protein 1A